jgi:hypothetical protein
MGWMGLDEDGWSKILSGGGQEGSTEGCVVLDGPQRRAKTAQKSKILDGCREVLLDGPQRGKRQQTDRQ